MGENARPAPGDRVRRIGTDQQPASSGLFERWSDLADGIAVVHWDDQPFHVYDDVPVGGLEVEPAGRES